MSRRQERLQIGDMLDDMTPMRSGAVRPSHAYPSRRRTDLPQLPKTRSGQTSMVDERVVPQEMDHTQTQAPASSRLTDLPQMPDTPSGEQRTTVDQTPSSGQTSKIGKRVMRAIFHSLFILVLAAVLGCSVYVVVHFSQRVFVGDKVEPHYASWRQDALELAYQGCYNGCTDCVDQNYAFDACERTMKVNVTGVVCDGNQIWNWQDRYPDACLEALGKTYKVAAEEKLLESDSWRAFRIALPIGFGIVALGLIWRSRSHHQWSAAETLTTNSAETAVRIPLRNLGTRSSHASRLPPYPNLPPPPYLSAGSQASRPANSADTTESTARADAPPARPRTRSTRTGGAGSFDSDLEKASEELIEPQCQSAHRSGSNIKSSAVEGKSKFTTRRIATALGLVSLFGSTAGANICKDNVTMRHFTNADHTIFGNVRGWLASECSEFSCHCRDVNCRPKQDGNSDQPDCDEKCDTCVRHTTGSLDYVNNIKPKIASCGFGFVNGPVGKADKRVANAMIEKKWLVTITVNTFNVTGETAQQVWCLYNIGHQFP